MYVYNDNHKNNNNNSNSNSNSNCDMLTKYAPHRTLYNNSSYETCNMCCSTCTI